MVVFCGGGDSVYGEDVFCAEEGVFEGSVGFVDEGGKVLVGGLVLGVLFVGVALGLEG